MTDTPLNRVVARLRYPLQGSIATAIVAFALLLLLARSVPLIGLFLMLVTLSALFQHLFLILRDSAMGKREAPAVSATDFDFWQSLALVQVLVLTAMFVVAHVLTDRILGPGASVAATLAMAFLLPAMLAQLVVNGSLRQALNPVALGATVVALWPAYLWMTLWLLLALALGPVAAAVRVPLLLADFLTLYSLYLAMHLIGRTLFEQRDLIGLVAINSDTLREQHNTEQRDKERAGMLAEAYQKARTDTHGALDIVTTWLAAGHDDSATRRWLADELRGWSDPRLALALAPGLIERDLHDGDADAALDAALWAVGRNPAFRLRTAPATLKLAQLARQNQKPRLVTALLDGFLERYPGSPHAPSATLLAAQLALEKTGETELARRNLALLEASRTMQHNATFQRLRAALPDAGADRASRSLPATPTPPSP